MALIIMSLFGMFLLTIFYRLYALSKQNIENMYETTASQAARDVRHYFTMPMDAVAFSAVKLNTMLKEKASHDQALEYVVNQTAVYSSIIDENNTGVYTYYDGEYLDGSGWIPPDDYDPKSRDWYKYAKEAGGKITLVKPYYNLQTFTIMMSVSQLLDDGDSVVSMDIFLDSVQEMTEDVHTKNDIEEALVMDSSGMIVAASDSEKVGNIYSEIRGSYEFDLYRAAFKGKENILTISSPDGPKMLFISEINDNWKIILVVDKSVAFRSLNSVYILSGAATIFTLIILILIFIYVHGKEKESRHLSVLSETDRMTGVKNHAAGEVDVRHLIQSGAEGMFCIMDADDFKGVNDNYGHDVGDKVIKAIADCLKKTFRDHDVIYRLGGDEFAVFAEGITNEETAIRVLNRFFENLKKMNIDEIKERCIFMSVGVTFCDDNNDDTFEKIYKRADEGVYESKKHSGNHISFSSNDVSK